MIDRLAALAKCPFYIRSAEYSITCEGIADGQEVATRFSTAKGKRAYAHKHCEQIDSSCPIRRLLLSKYEDCT